MRADFLPGISVELRCNDQTLQEYDDTDTAENDHRRVTRFVEAVPNSRFSVHLFVERKFPYLLEDLVLGIRVDGEEIASYVVGAEPYHEHRHSYEYSIRNINGVGQKWAFSFGELKTTDEEIKKSEIPKLKDIVSQLGEVNVWLRRARYLGRNPPKYHEPRTQSRIGETVHEKALKGRSISSRVKMTEAGTCPAKTTSYVDYPHGSKRIVKFVFKYRSHRDLQIEGIIPRSPSPVPLEDLDLDNMTREEAIEALRQKRSQTAPSTRIKRERAATLVIDLSDDDDSDDGDEGGVSITSAGPVKKRQRISNDSGIDIIDLTDG